MQDIFNALLGELSKAAGDSWLMVLMILLMQVIFGVTLIIIMRCCVKSISKAYDKSLEKATQYSENVVNTIIAAYSEKNQVSKELSKKP